MAKRDVFANIAMEQKKSNKDELEESIPLETGDRYFSASNGVFPEIIEKSYGERLECFKKEFDILKEHYKPFMEDFTPVGEVCRKAEKLERFNFRYGCDMDKKDISYVLSGKGGWETVTIPDYRGPVGKWTGYYRTCFNFGKPAGGKRVFLRFQGVDYIANVYLNGRSIGSHEGFFAPFEFHVSDYLVYDGENILVVEVRNDIPTLGVDDEKKNGDKIYAATGLGWDDPKDGWHHCPPGAGIYNSVILEERPEIFIDSVFVRPDIDNSRLEARVQIFSTISDNRPIRLALSVYPRNFKAEGIENILLDGIEPAGSGMNYYRAVLDIPECRLWECGHPWLYTARVRLSAENGEAVDEKDAVFGMRKFHMDENSDGKGDLYLNNKPVILRGANDMGHMQQCVLKSDFDRLVGDILIAKLANMNYYRFTQRPVQEEIYHYCDMLGMMNQTDLPLFGYLRRNQMYEAIRQSGEMERLIRCHPSAIMVSYINESSSVEEHRLGHRHLYRDELEAFFEAADRAVKVENPDRVVKHVEGDYDPPTGTGLSDFHCYNMWYTNHALPVGKLYKGYLPALKRGWKTGCGEYGTEGLDNYDVMRNYYPEEWMPKDDSEGWKPDRIVRSQTNSMHGDWFEEQDNIRDWIKASQKHQAFATKLMTDAFRRRSDRIVSTAVHLLIDAWPSGWMKTLVGVDRIPKLAYFSFKDSLEPVRVNLRSDRWKAYCGETVYIEAWTLNDTPYAYTGCRLIATLRDETGDYSSFEMACDIQASASECAGIMKVTLPQVKGRKKLYLDAGLLNMKGEHINSERFVVEVFERANDGVDGKALFVGESARRMLEALRIPAVPFGKSSADCRCIVISDTAEYRRYEAIITDIARKGARVIFLEPENGEGCWKFGEHTVRLRYICNSKYVDGVDGSKANGIYFVAADRENSLTKGFMPGDFSYLYNAGNGMIDFTAVKYMEGQGVVPLLYTYKKPAFAEHVSGNKERLPVAGELEYGEGKVIFLSLSLEGRTGVNPALDGFISSIMK